MDYLILTLLRHNLKIIFFLKTLTNLFQIKLFHTFYIIRFSETFDNCVYGYWAVAVLVCPSQLLIHLISAEGEWHVI